MLIQLLSHQLFFGLSSEIVVILADDSICFVSLRLKPVLYLKLLQIMDNSTVILVFLAFNLFWAVIVALTISLTRRNQLAESTCKHIIFRGVKTAHGCIAFMISATVLSLMLLSGEEPSPYITQTTVLLSGSYYFFDLIFAFWMRMAYPSLIIHHIVSVFQILGWLNLPPYYFFTALALVEVSVGPMNFREILRHLDMKFTKLFILNEKAFFYSILVGRAVLLVPLVVIPMYLKLELPLLLKVTPILVVGLSYYYCWQIFKKLRGRWSQYQEIIDKGVELGWLETDQSTLRVLSFAQTKEERQI